MRLLGALLSEGLMVLATRQHVKAWEGELSAVYRAAAWYLYDELWRWAAGLKPDLSAADRRRLLDRLVTKAPARSREEEARTAFADALRQRLRLPPEKIGVPPGGDHHRRRPRPGPAGQPGRGGHRAHGERAQVRRSGDGAQGR